MPILGLANATCNTFHHFCPLLPTLAHMGLVDEGAGPRVTSIEKAINMSTAISSEVIRGFPELIAMFPEGVKLFAFFAFLAFLAFLAWLKQGRK